MTDHWLAICREFDQFYFFLTYKNKYLGIANIFLVKKLNRVEVDSM